MKIRKIIKNMNRFGFVHFCHKTGREIAVNKVKSKFEVQYSHVDLSLELENRNHLKGFLHVVMNEARYFAVV